MNKIIFIFLISSQILSAQTLNDLYFGTDTTFDIISWNIEWFPKNNNTASEVQEILAQLEADVYALQEIEDTTLLKQVVSNIPGYECHFKSSYYGGLTYVYYVNTVQVNSKYEIYSSHSGQCDGLPSEKIASLHESQLEDSNHPQLLGHYHLRR